MTAERFTIGGDMPVARIGFGTMRLTGQPGNFGPYADWEGGKAPLRQAVAQGVDFIDTARSYGPGWNETLIAEALYPYPAGLVIATKGGIDKLAPDKVVRDASPATLHRQVDDARRRLKLDCIHLFQLHWVDPAVPIETSVAALADLQAAGTIRHIGLCNVTAEQLARAQSVAPIAAVQSRFNMAMLASTSATGG